MAGAQDVAALRLPDAFEQQEWAEASSDRLSVALNAIVQLADHSTQRYAHPPQQPGAGAARDAAASDAAPGERDLHAMRLEQAAYVRMGEQSLLRGMKRAALLCQMEEHGAGESGDECGSEEPWTDEEDLTDGDDELNGEFEESPCLQTLAVGFGPGGGEAAQQRGAGSQPANEGQKVRPYAEDLAPEKQAMGKRKL